MSPESAQTTQLLAFDNIEEIKAELERLRIENNVLKQVMDDMVEGVCLTDEHENIRWINRTVMEEEGLVRDEVIGRPEAEVYKNIGLFNRITARTGKAIPARHAQYYLPDGRRIDALLRTRPYFIDGQLRAVATIGYGFNHLQAMSRWVFDFEFARASQGKTRPNRTKFVFKDIIGRSEAIKEARKVAQKAALTEANVLIYGETGTGKELFAQSIHNAGRKASGQFVAVNCSAIPETLLESILFGTAKGAFTGAVESPGLFELADGGSLFLDEINSMPLELQAKILRVLQEREVQRLGEKKLRSFDCRIISATNVEPRLAIKEKQLREDIYFRLATITLIAPPLRERMEDLPLLISHFLGRLRPYAPLTIKDISGEVVEIFHKYRWPGNVRELEHSLEFAAAMLEPEENRIETTHLPPALRAPVAPAGRPGLNGPEKLPALGSFCLPKTLNRLEFGFIKKAMLNNNNMITKAAQALGVSRQALYYRMKKLREAGYQFGDEEMSDL